MVGPATPTTPTGEGRGIDEIEMRRLRVREGV